MVERRVEDQLRRVTPPLIGSSSGSAFFTEEDLQVAFPRSKNVDTGIDFGDLTLLAEVVTTQVALPTRENADVAAFNKAIGKFSLKKAMQLDETAANLLRDPQPDSSPLHRPARRILPVAVRGGQFPINRSPAGTSRTPYNKKGFSTTAAPPRRSPASRHWTLKNSKSARRCTRHATCPCIT
ncbi:MAG: hypothetical protein ACLPKE_12835 [Streptosporangiaceae bacterium]